MMWKMSDEADVEGEGEGEVYLEDGGEDYTRERQDWLPEDPEALKEGLIDRESIGYLRGRDRGRGVTSKNYSHYPDRTYPEAPLREINTSIKIAIVQIVSSKNGTIGGLAFHFCIVRVEQ